VPKPMIPIFTGFNVDAFLIYYFTFMVSMHCVGKT
jgi:hypothetical protein